MFGNLFFRIIHRYFSWNLIQKQTPVSTQLVTDCGQFLLFPLCLYWVLFNFYISTLPAIVCVHEQNNTQPQRIVAFHAVSQSIATYIVLRECF